MLSNWRFGHHLAGLVVLAAGGIEAEAYTLIPLELEQLARQAEVVAAGRVTALEPRFNDEDTMILTHVTIEVDLPIAGDVPATLEITEYGGRVGDRAMLSPAQVLYEPGEQVLVFGCRDALDQLRTCGAHQGRMRVTTAKDGSTEAEGNMAGRAVRFGLVELQARVAEARGRSK